MKKATMQDLISLKMMKEKKQQEVTEIEVTSMGATLSFKAPPESAVCELMDEVGNGDTQKTVTAYKKMIYLCCDQLQDPKLHEELGIIDPFDTVEKLFDLAEVMGIGEQLTESMDLEGRVKVIKNS